MAAGFPTMQQHPHCCAVSAAACASMRFSAFLDTAVAAVSIFVLFLILAGLLVMQA